VFAFLGDGVAEGEKEVNPSTALLSNLPLVAPSVLRGPVSQQFARYLRLPVSEVVCEKFQTPQCLRSRGDCLRGGSLGAFDPLTQTLSNDLFRREKGGHRKRVTRPGICREVDALIRDNSY
jgi:hypothetical protein